MVKNDLPLGESWQNLFSKTSCYQASSGRRRGTPCSFPSLLLQAVASRILQLTWTPGAFTTGISPFLVLVFPTLGKCGGHLPAGSSSVPCLQSLLHSSFLGATDWHKLRDIPLSVICLLLGWLLFRTMHHFQRSLNWMERMWISPKSTCQRQGPEIHKDYAYHVPRSASSSLEFPQARMEKNVPQMTPFKDSLASASCVVLFLSLPFVPQPLHLESGTPAWMLGLHKDFPAMMMFMKAHAS